MFGPIQGGALQSSTWSAPFNDTFETRSICQFEHAARSLKPAGATRMPPTCDRAASVNSRTRRAGVHRLCAMGLWQRLQCRQSRVPRLSTAAFSFTDYSSSWNSPGDPGVTQ